MPAGSGLGAVSADSRLDGARSRFMRGLRALPDGVSAGDDHAAKKCPPRVHAPYAEPDDCRIILVTDGNRKSLKYPTLDAAAAAKARRFAR